MLEGLGDVQKSLEERGIKFVARKGAPDEVALRLGETALMFVSDGAYPRLERSWRLRYISAGVWSVRQTQRVRREGRAQDPFAGT